MPAEFVVRVGMGFISKSDIGQCRLVTYTVRNAARYTKPDALAMACCATTVFPEDQVFVAHEDRPDKEFNTTNPPEFVIVIGRSFLKSITDGHVLTTFVLSEAARFSKPDASDFVRMFRLTWPSQSVHTAHEDTPFIAAPTDEDEESDDSSETEGKDESDHWNDLSEE